MKMMNIEEGFRRIGVSIVVVSLFVGAVTALFSFSLFVGVLAGAGLTALLFVVLRLTVYVIKGFVKEDRENKNAD